MFGVNHSCRWASREIAQACVIGPGTVSRYLQRAVRRELKRDGVTLQLLWEEYGRVHPSGYRRRRWRVQCCRR